MEKGQSGTIALSIIGLIIVGLLAFIAIKVSSPVITGNTIIQERYSNTLEENPSIAKGKLTSNTCRIDAPFYCNAWNIQNGKVILEIKNSIGQIYNIKSITLSACGSKDLNLNIKSFEMQTFEIFCSSASEDELFRTDISIEYYM